MGGPGPTPSTSSGPGPGALDKADLVLVVTETGVSDRPWNALKKNSGTVRAFGLLLKSLDPEESGAGQTPQARNRLTGRREQMRTPRFSCESRKAGRAFRQWDPRPTFLKLSKQSTTLRSPKVDHVVKRV